MGDFFPNHLVTLLIGYFTKRPVRVGKSGLIALEWRGENFVLSGGLLS
jgi:hypothetical protein